MSSEETNNGKPSGKSEKRRGYLISEKRIKITGIMFLAVFVLILFLMSPIFSIKSIEVTGNSNLDEEVIITASRIKRGDNIFSVNVHKAIEEICSLERITSAEVTRKLPSRVVIDVHEETESGYIKLKNEYVGIDPNCKVLVISPEMTAEAPVITGMKIKEAKIGQFLKAEDEDGAQKTELVGKILAEAKSQDIIKNISIVDVTNIKDIHLTLTSDILVNLGQDGKEADDRIEYKIAYLKAIISRIGNQQGGVIELSDTKNVTSRAS